MYPPPSWCSPILNSVNLTRTLIFQKELRSGYGTNETDGLRTNEVLCEIPVTFFVFCVCSHTTLFFWWGFFFVILWWRLCLLRLFNLSLTFSWTNSFEFSMSSGMPWVFFLSLFYRFWLGGLCFFSFIFVWTNRVTRSPPDLLKELWLPHSFAGWGILIMNLTSILLMCEG